jgi:hypothetical protein
MELELTQEELARISDTTHQIQSAEEALTAAISSPTLTLPYPSLLFVTMR